MRDNYVHKAVDVDQQTSYCTTLCGQSVSGFSASSGDRFNCPQCLRVQADNQSRRLRIEDELQNALRLLGDKETKLQNALGENLENSHHAHRLDVLINRQPTDKPLGELVDQVETMFAQIREQMAALQLNLAKLREGRNAQRDPGALILPDDRRH